MIHRLIPRLKQAVAHTLLTGAFLLTTVLSAQCEELILFHEADPVTGVNDTDHNSGPIVSLAISGNGGLLINIGSARFTLAYTPPMDRFKSTEQQNNPRRDQAASFSGISLTACLIF